MTVASPLRVRVRSAGLRTVWLISMVAILLISVSRSWAGEPVGLEELEILAIRNSQTLARAASGVDSAEGRRIQAGLYPNPIVGRHDDAGEGLPAEGI